MTRARAALLAGVTAAACIASPAVASAASPAQVKTSSIAASSAAPATTPAAQEAAELEHTRLDNERLEREASKTAWIQRWQPLLSVLVAVAGALLALWRYRDERRRERRLRTEEAIARNLEWLLDRPENVPAVRVVAVLRSLDALAPAPGEAAPSDAPAGSRDRVTDTLEAIVRNELAVFDSPSAALLPTLFADGWKPFADRVTGDVALCRSVLDRYHDALKAFRLDHPQYAASLTLRDGSLEATAGKASADALRLLGLLVAGYQRYTELLLEEPARSEARDRFATALNNRALPGQVWSAA